MIYVIGIGADGRGSLSKRALGVIGRAGLIAGGRRHLDEFPGSGARKVAVSADLDGLSGIMERYIRKCRVRRKRAIIAVLATGDPLLFGIGDFILKRFGKKGVEIIPNVSTVQEAFARIKESLNSARVFSVHGKDTDFEGLSR